MSKTNDTERTRALTEAELHIVVGGTSNSDWSSWIRPLLRPIPYPGGNPEV